MVAKLQRKPAPRRASRTAARTSKPRRRVSAGSARVRIGRMISLASMAAAGLLVVVGVGAIVLLVTEPAKRSGKWGGWNFNDLSNSARESLRANLPRDWRRSVRQEYLPEMRAFVERQSRRFT